MAGLPIARGPMGGDNYTAVHNLVFRDRRLSARAMGIFAYLSTHTGPVSVETIAAAMRDGRDAIRSGLRELETASYLVRFRPQRKDEAPGPEMCWVTDLPAQIRATGITDPQVIEAQVRAAFAAWERAMSQPMNNNPSLVGLPTPPLSPPPVAGLPRIAEAKGGAATPAVTGVDASSLALFADAEDRNEPPAPATGKALNPLFEEFYDSYPKRRGRKEAERKFGKAVRDGADPRTIIDGARRYAEAMTGESERFIAYPATWLHQGRWMDEDPKPEPRPARSDGYQPYRNPVDQSVYDEEMY